VRKTVVINAVALTQNLIERMPAVKKFARAGSTATITPILPALTCSMQATYLTGTLPAEHGIVGNGWYFRDQCEVKFWHQSDKLVQRPRIWEIAKQRDPTFTCANLFWWNAMYSKADVTVTPRPMYPADGQKLPDLWTNPSQLRIDLQKKLGQFPLFKFWGPATSIQSTQWIADAAMEVDRQFNPTLSLIYLPHLDYCLQKFGPNDSRINSDLAELDAVIAKLLSHYKKQDAAIAILSEYGIESVDRPIHINRILREQNLLTVRDELGHELLDAGASAAFAVADHQIAHVYVNDESKMQSVRKILETMPGVAKVIDSAASEMRAGDFIVVAEKGAWFSYYYWLDDAKAPDFAPTVDIHRKPGYDPVELFFDEKISKANIAWKLFERRLGLRTLLNVIPLDANLVRGSHGRISGDPNAQPIFISSDSSSIPSGKIKATDVRDILLKHLQL
jgi:predicted AlkP superfamily pyrophosphatase or phosphodiesterase